MKKVLAGGCFNSVHPGHMHFLRKAKEKGDFLVVVLANDEHNCKPYARPAAERKLSVEKLGIADRVVIGSAVDFSKVVEDEKPDVIALGYDQELLGKTREAAKKIGARIVRIRRLGKYGTRHGH